MRRESISDIPFVAISAALIVGGLFFISSASVALSAKRFGNIYYYSLRQLLAILIGLALFLVVQRIPLKFWKRFAVALFSGAVVLLGLVLLPQLGLTFGGAQRWLDLGFFSFQPSELAKLAMVIFLAWWFGRVGENGIRTFRLGFLPFFLAVGLVGGLIFAEPDLGTFFIIAGSSVILYFVAGGRWRYLLLFLALGLISFTAMVYLKPYVGDRLHTFIDPTRDPLGAGFQVRQAAIAIGSGGFWGLGYGSSQQKESFLPEPIGDSIFAVIAEEFGYFGVILLVTAYLIFLWRGIAIAKRAPDLFAKLTTTGIIGTIVLQAFINMGSISGLLPLTGIPLPFISYGGTSLAVNFIGLGIVYRISKTRTNL